MNFHLMLRKILKTNNLNDGECIYFLIELFIKPCNSGNAKVFKVI